MQSEVTQHKLDKNNYISENSHHLLELAIKLEMFPKQAMNILIVSEAGNRQPAGSLARSTAPAEVKPVRWGSGR